MLIKIGINQEYTLNLALSNSIFHLVQLLVQIVLSNTPRMSRGLLQSNIRGKGFGSGALALDYQLAEGRTRTSKEGSILCSMIRRGFES